MMRALTNRHFSKTGIHPLARPCIASLGALALASIAIPTVAQNSPRTFSLPQPTPTPTATPQGPADERSGVRIGPRVIDQEPVAQTPAPTQTAAPAPAPAPTPSPTPTPTATAAPVQTRAPASTRTTASRAAQDGQQITREPAPAQSRSQSSPGGESGSITRPANSDAAGALIQPGFDTDLLPEDVGEPIGPDDWYDVGRDGETDGRAEGVPQSGSDTSVRRGGNIAAIAASSLQDRVLVGFALLALVAALLGFVYWRRRRREFAEMGAEGLALVSGVHRVIANSREEDLDIRVPEDPGPALTNGDAQPADTIIPVAPQTPAAPTSSPDEELPRLDIELSILSASRSMMMFTIEFSVEIANRSDRAVRDLAVRGELVSARRGASETGIRTAGEPFAQVERIGPQQSRRVTGQLQLPIAQIHLIQQGSKPLFIPLLHLGIEKAGNKVIERSFVIGLPSTASLGRVHPISLQGPPGGLPQLRAQPIKQPRDGPAGNPHPEVNA